MTTLASHSEPTIASIPQGFKLPTIENGTFEIRPSYINLVEQNLFGGTTTEDPSTHMEKFVTYCCSILLTAGVTQDQLKQVLFLFSLKDGATEWLRDLDMADEGITDWNTLALAFYKRYFPPQKTNALRSQISSFKQGATEDLNEAWTRFKRLVRSVPHHGFPKNPRGSTRGIGGDSALAAQLETISVQIAEIKTTQSLGSKERVHAFSQLQEESCARCGLDGYNAAECLSTLE
ncbi:uncharacterized protein LOC141640057 [Silene latifolia]|uniref:uncharacterized protein LOC141640057 n=1 Tax=Silene latifolia TaxID=37657 RepID=UPI003D7858E8